MRHASADAEAGGAKHSPPACFMLSLKSVDVSQSLEQFRLIFSSGHGAIRSLFRSNKSHEAIHYIQNAIEKFVIFHRKREICNLSPLRERFREHLAMSRVTRGRFREHFGNVKGHPGKVQRVF